MYSIHSEQKPRLTVLVLLIVFVYGAMLPGQGYERETTLVGDGGTSNAWFGSAVDLDETLVIVGTPYSDTQGYDSGSAYVYRYKQNTWRQEAKLLPDASSEDLRFGESGVAISGNFAMVGAPSHEENIIAGQAYFYQYLNGSWKKTQSFTATSALEKFGTSVAIDGNFAAVGASNEDNVGAVHMYSFDGRSGRNSKYSFR